LIDECKLRLDGSQIFDRTGATFAGERAIKLHPAWSLINVSFPLRKHFAFRRIALDVGFLGFATLEVAQGVS
jgi:hypothetical protein